MSKGLDIILRGILDNSKTEQELRKGIEKLEKKIQDKAVKVPVKLNTENLEKDKRVFFKSIDNIEQQMREKFKGMGTVKVQVDRGAKGNIENVLTTITKASGEVEKLKFKLASIDNVKGLAQYGKTTVDDTQKTKMKAMHAEALEMNKFYDKKKAKEIEMQKLHVQALEMNKKFDTNKMNAMHKEALAMNRYYDKKEKRELDIQKAHVQALKMNKKFDTDRMNAIHAEANAMNKFYDKKKQRELEIQKLHLKALEMNKNFDRKKMEMLHTEAIEINKNFNNRKKAERDIFKFQQQMQNKITGLKGSSKGAYVDDIKLKQLQERVLKLTPNMKNLRHEMGLIRDSFSNINKSAANAGAGMMKFGEAFKQAWQKFPIWIATATIFMQTINAFRFGVNTILEMDKALTDLSKVVNFTNDELNDMRMTAISLGKEFGKSSVEIMKSFAEFGRVAKNTEDIKKLSEAAILASNVSTLSADQAAKSINTAMIAFKLGVGDAVSIVDKFNEIQNNFRYQ